MQSYALILEIDSDLRRSMTTILQQEGLEVVGESNGDRGLAHAAESSPNIILVSDDMQTSDGVELLALLRRVTSVPIIVLGDGDTRRVVEALLNGADMYLKTPFNYQELVSRVRALLRRAEPRFNSRNGEVCHVAPANVLPADVGPFLTHTESWLFRSLMERYGQVVRHEELMMKVWGKPVKKARLRFYIHRLRKKLSNVMTVSLHTRNGVGYILGPSNHAGLIKGLPND